MSVTEYPYVRPRQPEGGPTRVAVIQRIVQETPESATYWCAFRGDEGAGYEFQPGQFNMVYLFGVGEVAISISSDPGHPQRLGHTIRAVGRVTNALAAIEQAMRHRDRYRRLILLMGARTPELLPYRNQLDEWVSQMEQLGVELHLTVDEKDDEWPYQEGVVTTLFPGANIEPAQTTAFVCGPEIMMRFAGRGLLEMGVPIDRLWLSMERHMQCGIQLCGHCQLGPWFVCSDGPVFRYDTIRDLMEVREL